MSRHLDNARKLLTEVDEVMKPGVDNATIIGKSIAALQSAMYELIKHAEQSEDYESEMRERS